MNGQTNFGELKPVNYFLTIAVVLGLLFAFIAPDNELEPSWIKRALLWQIQTVVPMLIAILIQPLLTKPSNFIDIVNPWVRIILSGFVACVLVSPIALLGDIFLANETPLPSVGHALREEFFALTPPVLICWLAINAPFIFGWKAYKSTDNNSTFVKPSNKVENEFGQTNFERMVPIDAQGELIYLKSELHYLQVMTTNGKSLILYSMKSATSELTNIDGLKPHRSYWVNKKHIKSLTKTGREGILKMSNGDEIPVSRTKMRALKSSSFKI